MMSRDVLVQLFCCQENKSQSHIESFMRVDHSSSYLVRSIICSCFMVLHKSKFGFVGDQGGDLLSAVSEDLCWSLNPRRVSSVLYTDHVILLVMCVSLVLVGLGCIT
ncbi:hypothetical protein Hanom_Chr06g00478141 [Helianthus anomalus]